MDNFIDYLIPNYFVGNYDWGHKNWFATRHAGDPGGLWRFHHWDGEHLMENLNENVTGRDNAGGPSRLQQRLAQNAEYRLLFADHVHRHFFNEGALTPKGAIALYRIRLNDVDRAAVGESARWGDNQIDRFAHIRYMRDPHWLL
ncbi:MAG: CotH kinase family protein [Phycisphaerae bacterium]|nr:CotH kinase family protein [Phycisphaerae bacterium]